MLFKNGFVESSQDKAFTDPRLPPTPGRIFRVTAGLDAWTPQERAWLKQHPGLIAYQDQLEATLEEVHRELDAQRDADEAVAVATGSDFDDCWGV
jgi:hypothetical protein